MCDEFLKALKTGNGFFGVSIPDIPRYYDLFRQHLISEGLSGGELLVGMRKLRGICPECYAWFSSSILGKVTIVREKKWSLIGEYGVCMRMLDGLCGRDSCSSRKILLIWKGLPNIERLVNDCIGKASETKSIDIQRLLDPEVIWYATDIIFIFSLIGWVSELFLAGHPYIGHRFSAIHVWVSVLPSCSSERIKYMFPGGYLSFWDQLVSESNYNSGDVAVMHWVYVHSRREQPILHVSFLASKKDIEEIGKSGGVVIPVDFLNKEERDRLGLP